ncbi:Triacylglycerol lipase 2 [Nakaseomyces bracarensis]|uniref:Triacylglycerol lipase 2 n=1 Tax=Nakaseomyces bracarensis TaxID=273131 RepID=A0ABR4P013_9SACH
MTKPEEKVVKQEFDVHTIEKIPTIEDYKAPKYPIVLCHGLSGFDKLILIPSVFKLTRLLTSSIHLNNSDHFLEGGDQDSEIREKNLLEIDYWIGVKEILEKNGCQTITTKVPGFGSIEERALALAASIEREVAKLQEKTPPPRNIFGFRTKTKVNLLAHSMGGLDCRYLIAKMPKRNYEVASLTTISTPHRGSEMADYVVNLFLDLKPTNIESSNIWLPTCFYQLTTSYMAYFNQLIRNDPKVKYFSYGSYFEPKWYNVLAWPWKVIAKATNGDLNDGLVTIKSSQWGKYEGTLKNVDHLDIINWKNKLQDDLFKRFPKIGYETVNVLDFYLQVTDNLARNGL